MNKILILTASIGSGHIKAAEAVETELRRLLPDAEITTVDFMARRISRIHCFMKDFYLMMLAFVPNLYDVPPRGVNEHFHGDFMADIEYRPVVDDVQGLGTAENGGRPFQKGVLKHPHTEQVPIVHAEHSARGEEHACGSGILFRIGVQTAVPNELRSIRLIFRSEEGEPTHREVFEMPAES